MPTCPACSAQLDKSHATGSGGLECDNCGGQATPAKALSRSVGKWFFRQLSRISRVQPGQQFRKCLSCGATMDNYSFSNNDDDDDRSVVLSMCRSCDLVWFEGGARQELDSILNDKQPQAESPPKPQTEASIDRVFSTAPVTTTGWKLLPALFGLPIECSAGKLQRKPIATWATAFLLAAVLMVIMGFTDWESLAKAIWGWGLIPARAMRHGGLTFVTSFFLHAGWGHLIGNVYFLLVFGDNVEDNLGWLGFIGVTTAGHLGGMLLYMLVTSSWDIPCVGASAGISGILGCYAIILARTRLGWLVIVPFKWTLTILRIPALAVLGGYAALQAIHAMQAADRFGGGTAYAAHLGGLAVGALWGLAVVNRRNARDS